MSIDFKLSQNKGYWDLSVENGDIAKTDSLDTAVYMSVFCEKRSDKVSEPTLRRGHFTNQFNKVAGYQIGSLLWFYTNQAKQTESNLASIEKTVNDGLRWFVEDGIMSKTNVKAKKSDTVIEIGVDLIGKLQVNSKYYNLFIKL